MQVNEMWKDHKGGNETKYKYNDNGRRTNRYVQMFEMEIAPQLLLIKDVTGLSK